MAAAHEEARQVRAHTAEQVLRAADDEAAALLAEAEREAVAVRSRARSRTPELVDRVLALVLEDLEADVAREGSGGGS